MQRLNEGCVIALNAHCISKDIRRKEKWQIFRKDRTDQTVTKPNGSQGESMFYLIWFYKKIVKQNNKCGMVKTNKIKVSVVGEW